MQPINRIEALAAAFGRLNGVHDPFSKAFQLRNPLLLKAFSSKHERDEAGYRVFNSFSAGWDNALLDLKIKCSGNSHARLKTDDTLRDLVVCFGNTSAVTRSVKNFLRHALNDESISESQPLGWFLDDQKAVMTVGE